MPDVRCPTCGAPTPATGACRWCGGSALVDGIAGRVRPSDLNCPRCDGRPPLRGVDLDGLHVDVCADCHGVLFGPGGLDRAVAEAVKRPVAPGEGVRAPDHGGLEKVRYLRCPTCDGGMSRVPYSRRPLIIVDRCMAHGDWCDGGELGQLKNVARTRGVEALGDRPPPRQVPSAGIDPDNPLEGRRFAGEGLLTAESRRLTAESRSFGRRGRPDLFDILWDLFGS